MNKFGIEAPSRVRVFVKKVAFVSAVATAILGCAVQAQSLPVHAAAPAASAASGPVVAAQPHPLAKQLMQIGAMGCAARAHQLATSISNGRETSILQMPSGDADKSLLMATLIEPLGAQQNALIVMAMAPNQAVGCGAGYQKITYSEKSCVQALAENYPGHSATPVAQTGVWMTVLGRANRVLLMNAGTGCILLSEGVVE